MDQMTTDVVSLLEQLLGNDVFIGGAVAFVLSFVGRAKLQRVPLFGPVVRLLAEVVDSLELAYEANRMQKISAYADTLVTGKDQLKRRGKIDSGTAILEVVVELETKFGLERDLALVFAEAAVYRLRQREQHGPHYRGENLWRPEA